MLGDGKLLYPLLGVGCFSALFWVGVVAGHGLGLHPLSLVALGLIAGIAGVSLVVRLERHDPGA